MSIPIQKLEKDDEPDDYLLELIGLKQDFPEEAMEAYGKIYSRYWDFLLKVAKRVAKDEDEAMDLVSDTFNMVYNKASTFAKGKIRNKSNIRLSIQKWMTTIMERIFYDHFIEDGFKVPSSSDTLEESYIIENIPKGRHLSADYDEFIERLEDEEQGKNGESRGGSEPFESYSQNVLNIESYLSKLSERDRDIILTVYNYYLPGKYTPSEVLSELEQRWGTTRQNIRKILEKFRKAIKEDLQSKMFIRK